MRAILWVLGLAGVANGLWMIDDPAGWYRNLPARVPDTGPLNLHFVRDIGCAYAATGLALCAGAASVVMRRGVLLAATFFYAFHALLHVADIMAGRLPAEHWLIDLPGVFLPAVLLAVLCVPRFHRR